MPIRFGGPHYVVANADPDLEVLVLVDRLVTGIVHDAGDQLGPPPIGTCAADEESPFLRHSAVIPRQGAVDRSPDPNSP